MIGDILKGVADVLDVVLRFKTRKETIPKVLEDIRLVYSQLNHVVAASESCVRAVVLKTENGGGVPQLGNHLYSSAIYQVWDDVKRQPSMAWERQVLDETYVRRMLDMISAPGRTETFSLADFEGSVLHDVYVSQGIKSTIMVEIYIKKSKAYFYASFNFNKDVSEITPTEKNAVRIAATNLKNAFQRQKGF